MKRNNRNDHPEIKDIKNICDVSSDTKTTDSVCKKIRNEKISSEKSRKK